MDNQKSTKQSALIKAMLEKKKEYGFSYGEIADRSGLPLGTVQKVLGGFTKSPRRKTLTALAGVLLPEQNLFIEQVHNSSTVFASVKDAASDSVKGTVSNPEISSQANPQPYHYTAPVEEPLFLRDGAPAYVTGLPEGKKQGEYTIEDRNALPEDRPSELIDGVIYNMASPALRHQSISGAIYHQIWNYVDSHGGNCIPFIAPTDVRLDRDERTMVVPDVFVICPTDDEKPDDERPEDEKPDGENPGDEMPDGEKPDKERPEDEKPDKERPDDERMDNDKYINGAPDLIIEVLSPSTRRKDMFTKLYKYEAAGVREYWLVDPQKEKVIVYIFGEESDVSLYGFDSEIPVGIYQGDCRIDFKRILRDLKRLHL